MRTNRTELTGWYLTYLAASVFLVVSGIVVTDPLVVGLGICGILITGYQAFRRTNKRDDQRGDQ